ncbi:MAG: flagellar hook-basal body complex protein FliE [Oscillospiraceae bacterium]|nr:flagellar hook-basal body complex protein FliE [Oscillospiraceae bacterium]
MAITPIVPLTSITSLTSIEPLIKLKSIDSQNKQPQEAAETKTGFTFADMLRNMIEDVNETDAQTKTDAVNMAMGLTDLQDLHNIEINAIKADLALRTMTSVRNKVLEAYTEIMRITI